jgi:hypothetical protein
MMTVAVESIGADAPPLVILDDFAPGPDALRSLAAAADFGLGVAGLMQWRRRRPKRDGVDAAPCAVALGANNPQAGGRSGGG